MFQYIPPEKEFLFDCKFCNNVQIPSLPLKGPKPFEEILFFIYKAIIDEATAIDFYCKLLKEAPFGLQRDFIEHIYNDELCHLQIFEKLYCYYTDIIIPPYKIEPICIKCYKDGLAEALIGELKTVHFYKNVQLSTTDQLIIDTFYLAMVDEQNHATMISTLIGICS